MNSLWVSVVFGQMSQNIKDILLAKWFINIYGHDIFYSILQSLMPRSLWEHPTRKWPQQKSLHFSLFTHSLLACSNSPLYQYSFTLPFHLTADLPLLLGSSISFIHFFSSDTLYSSFSQDDQTTSKYFFFTHSTTPHFNLYLYEFPLHIFHIRFHYSYFPILSCCTLLADNSFP